MASNERSSSEGGMGVPGENPKSSQNSMFPFNRTNLPPRLSHSTRLLSADEVYNLFNNSKKTRPANLELGAPTTGGGAFGRSNRIASADGNASVGSASMVDEYSDVTSDGTLSRCTSTDRISLADGQVEDRFRVDRRKLEAMILGCPPDPCDFEIMKLPIGSDGRILSADDFFARVMETTSTDIRYPRLLKVGARNRKDPHVRIVGTPENVNMAGQMVRSQLEPHNKITMKMDVSWTHHSHIIGKAGNTIQPVVRRTGVSIHFPDGNKNNDTKKSNQVSINSRGDDLAGLEVARSSIRALTPLIFTFSLNANANFITLTGPAQLVTHIQNIYNVQVELSVTSDASPLLLGSVRGSENDVCRVKEATMCLLRNICGKLAAQLPVQMKIEVSPQHHSFILGRNNDNLKRIMQTTATNISFPSNNDPSVAPLQKSTITISGSINNVYTARQNIVGALPLTIMFEVPGNSDLNMEDLTHLMASNHLNIIPKNVRHDNRRPVVIRGAERDAERIYEAWKIVTRSDHKIPTVTIPPSYFISDLLNNSSIPQSFLSSRGISNPLSPHILPPMTPNFPQTGNFPPQTPTFPPSTPMLPPTPTWAPPGSAPPMMSGGTSFPFPPPPTGMLYEGNQRNSFISSHQGMGSSPSYQNMNSPLFFGGNNSPSNFNSSPYVTQSYVNSQPIYQNSGNSYNLFNNPNNMLRSVASSMSLETTPKQAVVGRVDASESPHYASSPMASSAASPSVHNSPAVTGVSSPADSTSPRDSSPEIGVVLGHIQSPPLVATKQATDSSGSPILHMPVKNVLDSNDDNNNIVEDASVRNLSSMLNELSSSQGWKKAPGAERAEKELETAMSKLAFSDYEAKQILASKAMREPVGGTVRVPTDNWSGYGFSKSSPSYQMRQQFMQAGILKKAMARNETNGNGVHLEDSHRSVNVWGDTEEGREWNDVKWSDGSGKGPDMGSSTSSNHVLSLCDSSNDPLGNSSGSSSTLSSNSSSGTVPSKHTHSLTREVFAQRLSASSISECVSSRNYLPHKLNNAPMATDLPALLTLLKMPQYIDMFQAQDVDLPMFLTLNDADLKNLGITAFGQRKKLLIAIKNMTSNLPGYRSSMLGKAD